ncbi:MULTISPECIES: glycosyltransferase family 2 protein [Colwellia]|uniref:Glycosyl transferase n=1 Tax=Colwellia marinimaniae TaxID=1513592 RepID=A0ABQ0MZL7_9GAMM|nr:MULTISPECIES: glycosyltransferase family 2 protein [Colwellia]GAW97800.1 glycosyl transferase [Colwellia marinimaniae]
MIDIVLATYNGESFLAEQIHSIQNNSGYKKWVSRLLVVDDGSTDATCSIVKELSLHDEKITWIENTTNQHGPSNNFAFGLAQTQSQYIMLSDQDDVWLPEKIQMSIDRIKQLEIESGSVPILVFSDKEVVDEQLKIICSSYFKLQNIAKNWHLTFEQLCQQNVVSGCTMLFNRVLLNKAMPIPEQAYMHDWWLALVASRCGKLELIDKPLIKYRQHNNNAIGLNQRSKLNSIIRFYHYLKQFEQSFLKIIEQAKAFEIFEQKNGLISNKTIKSLANVRDLSKRQKIALLINKTITRSHLLGKVALLIVLLKI